MIVTVAPPAVIVVAPLIAAEPNTIAPELASSAAISTASKPSVPPAPAPLASAAVPIFKSVAFSTARNVSVVPPLIKSPPAEFKSISSDTSVTLVSPVIDVFPSTVKSLSAARVKVILAPSISAAAVVPKVPVVTISTSPVAASTAPSVVLLLSVRKIPPVPVAALRVIVPDAVTLISAAPVAPIAPPSAVAVKVKFPAVTSEVLLVIFPVIARISSAFATTLTVPRPIPAASVI